MYNILLVEDDEALALGIKFTLKDDEFKVTRVELVEEAKAMFDSSKFDLVLLDVGLPDGSGYDVCKYIREKSNVPIIFLTACDDEVNVVLGLELGGDDYITKPFRIRELVSRIKAVLRRTVQDDKEKYTLKSGDIKLNISSMKVFKNDNEIMLTAQEYKLILIFMNNPNIVLNRELIMDKLLEGTSSFIDDNTLSVYIRRIREKIEEDSTKPQYIVTQRGLGYKWNKNVIKE